MFCPSILLSLPILIPSTVPHSSSFFQVGTRGQLVADVTSALSLIPAKEIQKQITKILNLMEYALKPPLWSSGQSFQLHIQMSGFDSRRYQIF
jgi:hypothetical protein